MSNAATYIRFINLTHAVTNQWESAGIDLLSLRLLEAIAIAHSEGAALTVTDAMTLNAIASPATMHRKLVQTFTWCSSIRKSRALHEPSSEAGRNITPCCVKPLPRTCWVSAQRLSVSNVRCLISHDFVWDCRFLRRLRMDL